MRMQVQACNYTLVKVVTLMTIIEEYDPSITEMSSTDRLSTSIVDEKDRSLSEFKQQLSSCTPQLIGLLDKCEH